MKITLPNHAQTPQYHHHASRDTAICLYKIVTLCNRRTCAVCTQLIDVQKPHKMIAASPPCNSPNSDTLWNRSIQGSPYRWNVTPVVVREYVALIGQLLLGEGTTTLYCTGVVTCRGYKQWLPQQMTQFLYTKYTLLR